MIHRLRRAPLACVCIASLLISIPPAGATAADHAPPAHTAKTTEILPLDDVRVGMKGYGLSVFHGVKIEPFAVEVISVMRNFTPGQGVIWVRCPDERMQKLGPVQGMSGSPIYLWDDGDAVEHQPGTGGRLIGALALGYTGTEDCYVGIQPIEQMRSVAGRAVSTPQASSTSNRPPHIDTASSHHGSGAVIDQVARLLDQGGVAPATAGRARTILGLARNGRQTRGNTRELRRDHNPTAPPQLNGRPTRMLLPLMVSSADLSQSLAPILTPLGLLPVPASSQAGAGVIATPDASTGPIRSARHLGSSGDTTAISIPPPGIDAATIKLEPGSVLSVPLAFGDLDLSAIGTVTEVAPDGRVLAFGHGLFSQGPMAVPMATGFVHLVMPSRANSFKLGGSAVIRGAIVRDEHSAVVGIPGGQFATAPVEIDVRNSAAHGDGGQDVTYHYSYNVVHHKRLTPFIAATVVLQSITARSDLPIDNTLRLRGQIRFTGDRVLKLDSVFAAARSRDLLLELLPLIVAMMDNPHESMALESIQLSVDIEPVLRSGSIVNALIDKGQVAPGDSLGITLQVQPYGKPQVKHHIELAIPQELADGEYELVICDAQAYLQLLFENRPHLLITDNADDLHRVLQRVLSVASDATYVVLQLPEPGLALGRQELPQLPSSRRALFDTPTNTLTTPYIEWVEKTVPMDIVTQGKMKFTVTVDKTLKG